MARANRRWTRWILAMAPVLLVLMLEVQARIVAGPPQARDRPLFLPHPHLVYKGNPALRRLYNRAGFGDREWSLEKPAGTLRVACVGASTTAGKRNWPYLLEQRLNEKSRGAPRFEVLNFGMQGYTSLESLINLVVNVADYEPDYVVIHHAFGDVIPRLYPQPQRDYSHFRKRYETGEGRLSRFLRAHSTLYAVIHGRLGLTPALATATMTVADEAPGNPYRPGVLNPDASIFRRNLERMVSVSRGLGSRPVLTTEPYSLDPSKLPATWSIDHDVKVQGTREHNQIVREIGAERGVPVVDLDARMTGREEYFLDHVHCLPSGRKLKAELVAQTILAAERSEEPP